MYWVTRLLGSRAWTALGINNAQVRNAAEIVVRGHLMRRRSDPLDSIFAVFALGTLGSGELNIPERREKGAPKSGFA